MKITTLAAALLRPVIASFAVFSVLSLGSIAYAEEDSKESAQNRLPEEITIDYANWNPLSLIIHERGILDEEFKNDNVKINWVFNPGGNKAMEFLLSKSADIASSADICVLLSTINGNPIKSVMVVDYREYVILSKPGSELKSLEDLKGKNVAITPATAPYAFTLKALDRAGINFKDIKIIPLQHTDGKNQLLRGSVDAWSGGDPNWAQAELEGAKPLYLNRDFNEPNVLSVRKEFLEQYPEAVYRVMSAYEKARKWANENHADYVALIVKRTKVKPDIAEPMLKKNNFNVGTIDETAIHSLVETGRVFQKAGIIKEDVDIEKAVKNIYDNSYYEEFTKRL